MKKQRGTLALGLLVVGLLIVAFGLMNNTRMSAIESQGYWFLFFGSAGRLIVLLSAGWVFVRAGGGASVAELTPWTFPILAGALLGGAHWSMALSLGLIVVAVVLRDVWSDGGGGGGSKPRGNRGDRGDGGRRKSGDRKPGNPSGGN